MHVATQKWMFELMYDLEMVMVDRQLNKSARQLRYTARVLAAEVLKAENPDRVLYDKNFQGKNIVYLDRCQENITPKV